METLIETLIRVLIPTLSVVAVWLVHKVIKYLEAKTKIDISAYEHDFVDQLVTKGIALAEEKARYAATYVATKITGPEKLEIAAGFVMNFIQSQGLENWTREKITGLVEAKLHEKRSAKPPALPATPPALPLPAPSK